MHKDRHFLRRLIPVIETYLKENLALQLHPKKIFLQHHSKGVNFLGATIKPHRRYISNRTNISANVLYVCILTRAAISFFNFFIHIVWALNVYII